MVLKIMFLFLWSVFNLNAQERVLPVLEWEAVEYAHQYEITIEKLIPNTDSYENALITQTEQTSLELDLPEGTYRYKITVFNLLGKADVTAGWQPLEIRNALIPVIKIKKKRHIYLDYETSAEITFDAKNIFEDSLILFEKIPGKENTGNPESGEIPSAFVPDSISFDGKILSLTVNDPPPGVYEARVINPGGLSASSQKITVYQYKPWNIDLAVSPPVITLMIPIAGDQFISAYSTVPSFLAMKLRLTFFPIKVSEMTFWGIELAPYWFFSYQNSATLTAINSISVHGNIVYHRYFAKKKLSALARFGLGTSWYLMPFSHDNSTKESGFGSDFSMPSVALGAALQFFPWDKESFIELNIDFFWDPYVTLLSPSIAFGRRF